MGHAEQVIDGLTEGFWIHFIKASHHPLKFQDDGQWHEDRRRFDHHAPRTRPLPLGFGVVGVVAVKAGEDVGINRNHAGALSFFLSRLAASNSARRLGLPVASSFTKP